MLPGVILGTAKLPSNAPWSIPWSSLELPGVSESWS